MPYYSKKQYKLLGFKKSNTKNKMYDAILEHKLDGKIKKVTFGDKRYQNYQDKTNLNIYPHLIHNDKERRRRYILRAKNNVKDGFYSPSYFSFYYLW